MKLILGLVAAGLLLAGLIVGFALPINAGSFSCGTAFKESGDLYGEQLVDTMTGGTGETDCDQERSSARTLPVVLIVLGVVAGIGTVFAPANPAAPDAPSTESAAAGPPNNT